MSGTRLIFRYVLDFFVLFVNVKIYITDNFCITNVDNTFVPNSVQDILMGRKI